MRIDLCVRCVLQKVSMFRKTIYCSLFCHFAKWFVRLFCKKQGCKTNHTFRKAVTFFSCFAVLRHRNQLFHQKPLSGGVKLTAASLFWNYFMKGSVIRCFMKSFVICLSKSFHKTDAKQAKNFGKWPLVLLFCEAAINRFIKNPICVYYWYR